MATEFYYKAGGTWLKAKEVWYKSGGTWLKAKEVWYKSGGTWRKVFSGFTPASGVSTGSDLFGSPNNVRVEFSSDGEILGYQAILVLILVNYWGLPVTAGVGANYWIRCTFSSGDGATIATGTLSSWLSMTSTQVWTMTAAPVAQSRTGTLTYSIATDSGGSNVVGGGSVVMISDRT